MMIFPRWKIQVRVFVANALFELELKTEYLCLTVIQLFIAYERARTPYQIRINNAFALR